MKSKICGEVSNKLLVISQHTNNKFFSLATLWIEKAIFTVSYTMLYITMDSYGSMWLCHKITQGNSHAECARLINPLSMYFNLTEMYWHAFIDLLLTH